MENRPRRLRDFFEQRSLADRPSTHRETDELIDEIAATHEPDVEGFAHEAMRCHRRLWHKVEDEIERGSKRRLRDRFSGD